MSPDLSSERSVVVATFSNRRDGEMALDRLEQEGVEAFLSADDAGGMHPHLQQTHGVKLLVLRGDAERANAVLEEAGLLPDGHAGDGASRQGERPGGGGLARERGGAHRSELAAPGLELSVRSAGFIVVLIVVIVALLVLALI